MPILKRFFKALKKIFNGNGKRRKFPSSKKKQSPKIRLNRRPKTRKSAAPKRSPKNSATVKKKKTVKIVKTSETKNGSNPSRISVNAHALPASFKKSSALKSSAQTLKAERSLKTKNEVLVGEITHYFDKIRVCVLKISGQAIQLGEEILVRGHAGEFRQTVKSLQVESQDVSRGKRGQLVGLKLDKPAQKGDCIYKI